MPSIEAPPPTPHTFLSLGAGVQSSTLALMAAHGEILPTPSAAIFADTQAEPASVYRWLDWLEAEIQRCPHPFPVIRVTKGNLAAKALDMRVTKDGRKFSKTDIPVFTRNHNGEKGMIPNRSCTLDFKIAPIIRKVRELAGINRGQKKITVTQWIGISWDEIQRMKDNREKWCQNRFPLIELRMKRHHCLDWMMAKGYPAPPRSACVFCPFHNDTEWRRLKRDEPEAFAQAVDFDKKLRAIKTSTDNFRTTPYLHSSRKPLDEVDFTNDIDRGQMTLWQDFNVECEGMCGV
jgi:hypothetical protein